MKTQLILKIVRDCFEIPLLTHCEKEHVISTLQRNGTLGSLNYLRPDKTGFLGITQYSIKYAGVEHAKKESSEKVMILYLNVNLMCRISFRDSHI